ncbi:MAG: recombinase family protein [Victivallales bacterium]
MKYLIYARVSPRGSDFEGETSIAMQLEICRRYVKKHGGTVVDERFDEFFPGKNTKRPEFQRVMDVLDSGRENGHIDCL